jgi:hypothetical protein
MNWSATTVENADIDYLDERLLEQGRLKLLPAAAYEAFPRDHVRLWAHRRGRYLLPTLELVAWLRAVIGGRKAIEVAAGSGDLGHHLGIPMSDSYLHACHPEMALVLAAMMVEPTVPASDVENLDALVAVAKYRPQVVVAGWLMQLYCQGDEKPPKIGSSVYGTDESKILDVVETYIHIGNTRYHGDKRILRRPHNVYRFSWVVSKAADAASDVIYVWNR